MRRGQTRAPEPMRSTLPNTDQQCIPHSEYHYNWRRRSSERVDLGLRDLLPDALLSPRQALFALHSFEFYFSRFFLDSFSLLFFFFFSRLLTYSTLFHPVSNLVRYLSPIRKPRAPPGLCIPTETLGLQLPRLCAVVAFRYIVFPCPLFVGHYY